MTTSQAPALLWLFPSAWAGKWRRLGTVAVFLSSELGSPMRYLLATDLRFDKRFVEDLGGDSLPFFCPPPLEADVSRFPPLPCWDAAAMTATLRLALRTLIIAFIPSLFAVIPARFPPLDRKFAFVLVLASLPLKIVIPRCTLAAETQWLTLRD